MCWIFRVLHKQRGDVFFLFCLKYPLFWLLNFLPSLASERWHQDSPRLFPQILLTGLLVLPVVLESRGWGEFTPPRPVYALLQAPWLPCKEATVCATHDSKAAGEATPGVLWLKSPAAPGPA